MPTIITLRYTGIKNTPERLELTMTIKQSMVQKTERLPGVLRKEIYMLDDMALTEYYDDLSGELYNGEVTMFNGVKVCTITSSGISVNVPMSQVSDHATMQQHINDLQRLDQFLSLVYKRYRL